MNYSPLQNQIDRLQSEFTLAKRQCKSEKKSLQQAKQHLNDVQDAQKIAQAISQQIQQQAHKQIAGVVSHCLKSVFGKDYSFRIDFLRKRGRTEAKLILIKDGNEVGNPMEDDSGGVLDVAGFAQRLSCLRLNKPHLRPLLILDEPFKNLHSNVYRERLRELIEKLSKDFGIQIILSTGIPDFEIGKVIRL